MPVNWHALMCKMRIKLLLFISSAWLEYIREQRTTAVANLQPTRIREREWRANWWLEVMYIIFYNVLCFHQICNYSSSWSFYKWCRLHSTRWKCRDHNRSKMETFERSWDSSKLSQSWSVFTGSRRIQQSTGPYYEGVQGRRLKMLSSLVVRLRKKVLWPVWCSSPTVQWTRR